MSKSEIICLLYFSPLLINARITFNVWRFRGQYLARPARASHKSKETRRYIMFDRRRSALPVAIIYFIPCISAFTHPSSSVFPTSPLFSPIHRSSTYSALHSSVSIDDNESSQESSESSTSKTEMLKFAIPGKHKISLASFTNVTQKSQQCPVHEIQQLWEFT